MKKSILTVGALGLTSLAAIATPVEIVEATKITEAFLAEGIQALPSGGSTDIRQTYAKGRSVFYHVKLDAPLDRISAVIPKIAESIKSEIQKQGAEPRSETPLQGGAYPTDYKYQILFDSPKLKGAISLSVLQTVSGNVLVVSGFEIE